jgi:hypothetical protein
LCVAVHGDEALLDERGDLPVELRVDRVGHEPLDVGVSLAQDPTYDVGDPLLEGGHGSEITPSSSPRVH